MLKRYLKLIREARVYDVAEVTPLIAAPRLSKRLDNPVWMKREDLQPVHSFKNRGAYNKIAQLSPAQRAAGSRATPRKSARVGGGRTLRG